MKRLAIIFLAIVLFRSFYLWALKRYRLEGGNFRNVVIIGANNSVYRTVNFIEDHPELGYRIKVRISIWVALIVVLLML